MKKTILLIVSTVLPFILLSQVNFQKYYGHPSSFQESTAILQMDDGGFLLGGTNGTTNGNGHDFWIVKVDSLGNEEWEKLYGDDNNQALHSMSKTYDNSYLLGGREQIYSSSDIDGNLLKLDSNFNVDWEITIGTDTINERILDIAPTLDSGCIALISGCYSHNTGVASSVKKIDKLGNEVWSYNTPDCILSFQQTSTNRNYLLGSKNNRTRVYEIDNNGNLLWEQEIPNYQTIPQSKQFPIAFTMSNNNDGLILAGSSENKLLLTKIDLDGGLIWQAHEAFSYYGYGGSLLQLSNGLIATIHQDAISIHNEFGEFLKLESYYYDYNFEFNKVVSDNNKLFIAGNFHGPDSGHDGGMITVDTSLEVTNYKSIGDSLPGRYERGICFTKDNSGGYILAGEKYFSGKGKDFYAIKTDANGEVIWESNFGGETSETVKNIIKLSDNNFILTGMDNHTKELLIKKINNDGSLNWESAYFFSTEWYSKIPPAEMEDGSILAAYSFFGSLQLIKYDNEGNFLWKKSTNKQLDIEDAILTSDGGFLCVGERLSFFDGAIHKCDPDGNTIFYKNIDIGSPDSHGIIYSIEELENNDFVAVGILTHDPEHSLFLIRLDNEGELIWSSFIDVDVEKYRSPVVHVISDTSFLVSVNADDYVQLLMANGDGELQWYQNYQLEYRSYIYDTEIIDGENLALFGTVSLINDSDYTLISVGADSGISNVHFQPLGDLNIYPNPFTENLNIFLKSPYHGTIEISIFSLTGQQLFHFKEEKTDKLFEKAYRLEDLPSGAFFVQIIAGDRSTIRKLIKP